MTVGELCNYLQSLAPLILAEDWDNVGLLVGNPSANVRRVMTCLTVTPGSADEAVDQRADLIVTHHPLPFRALQRITDETTTGRLLLQLIGNKVAVYSAHTAFDSAARGINQQLAEGLGLRGIEPLVESTNSESVGVGRIGSLENPLPLDEVAQQLKRFLKLDRLRAVGAGGTAIRRVAFACGSAGQLLDVARDAGCDLFVTGETNFHTCLEAEATNVTLLLVGHFASERFAMESLADMMQAAHANLHVWASQSESDPLRII